MKSLYVCSVESYSGKSAVCLTLMLHYKNKNKNVAYMKPIGTLPIIKEGKLVDEDVDTMYNALGKKFPIDKMSPMILSVQMLDDVLEGRHVDPLQNIKESFDYFKQNSDILFIEGASTVERGSIIGASAYDLCGLLDTKIVLTSTGTKLSAIDDIIAAKQRFKDRLLGVLFVSIPRSRQDFYEKRVVPYLKKLDIDCFGILPRKKLLGAVSVAQIEQSLNGRLLTAPQARDNLVETFLVGAMGQERALRFFRKKANKAVITGGDRADLQMAALETPTKCIILTGNMEPLSSILGRAEELGVPMILVEEDTWSTIQKVEKLTGRLSTDKPSQLEAMQDLINDNFNFDLLERYWKE